MVMSLIFVPEITVHATEYTDSYSGGLGTESSPYLLSTPADVLCFFSDTRSKMYYKVTADIDVASYLNSISSGATMSSSQMKSSFDGVLDGDGHTINVNYVATNSGTAFIGDLSGTIQHLNISGTVSGTVVAPFAITVSDGGKILFCSSSAAVSGKQSPASGIAFSVGEGGVIRGCYNTGSVSGSYGAGGIAYSNAGTISECYNRGSLSSGNTTNYKRCGIANSNASTGVIACCYNTAGTADYLIGSNSGRILYCYSLYGSVTGSDTGITGNCDIISSAVLKDGLSTQYQQLNSTGYFRIISGTNDSYPVICYPSIEPIHYAGIAYPPGAGIEIAWNSIEGAQGYYVRYGTSSSSLTNSVYTTDSSITISGLTPGATYYFTVTAAGGSVYESNSTAVYNIDASKIGQTITTGADSYTKAYGSAPFSLNTKVSSGVAPTYSGYDSRVVSSVSSDGLVTLNNPGTTHITITAPETGTYYETSKDVTITVNPATPTWSGSTVINKKYGDDPFDLGQSVTGGTITYGTPSNQNVVTLDGSVATIVGVGSATINLTAPANAMYSQSSRTVTVNVEKGDRTITTPTTEFEKKNGDEPFSLGAEISGGTMSYTSSDNNVVSVDQDGIVTVNGTGTATITLASVADSNWNDAESKTIEITVNERTPSWEGPTEFVKNYGDEPFNLNQEVSSGGALSYMSDNVSVAAVDLSGNVTVKGVGTANITVTAAEAGSYDSAERTVKITVNSTVPSAPTITSAQRAASGQIKIVWSEPVSNGGLDITNYVVTWYIDGQKIDSTSVGADVSDATITGLTNRQEYSFAVHAVNENGGGKVSEPKTAAPYADLTFETMTLATGVKGSAYSQNIGTAEGGLGSYTYKVTSGSLPTGLSLTADGVISGSPTASNTYQFTVTVTDSSGLTASAAFAIGVVDSLTFSGGNGSEATPYLISSADDMKTLITLINGGEFYLNEYFKLTQDITLTDWDHGFSTGGNITLGFDGYFDGDYHEITFAGNSTSGLFGRVTGTICNLGTKGKIEVSARDKNRYSIGAIVDQAHRSNVGTVENCYNLADINVVDCSNFSAYLYVGGLVGNAEYINCYDCYNRGNITVDSSGYIGGIAGGDVYNKGDFVDCYNTGKVTGGFGISYYESGFSNEKFTNCYTTSESGTSAGEEFGVITISEAEMKTADFVTTLGSAFKRDKAFVNDGFPILDGRRPADITVEWDENNVFTYDGSAKSTSVTAKNASNNIAVLLDEGDYDITYKGSVTEPSDAGVYTTEVVLTEEGQRYFSFAENEPTKTSALTINAVNPNAPTELKAVRDTSSSVKLTWTAPEFDGDGKLDMTYNVYYGTDAANLQKYPTQLTSGQSVTGLTAGETYYFTVSAVNSSGLESTQSSPAVSVLVYPDVTYTGKILPSVDVGKEYRQSIATATGGTGSFKYTVAVDSELPAGLSLSEDGILSGTPTAVVDRGSFNITAANDGGSATATFTLTVNAAAPNAPTLYAASGEDGRIPLSWTAPEFTGGKPLTKYILQRSTDGEQFDTIREPMSVDTKYTDSSLTNGTTYYYRMFAVNSEGLQSDPSETVEAKPYKAPEAPSDLTAKADSKYSIALLWTDIDNGGSDVTDYVVKVYSDEAHENEITSQTVIDKENIADNKILVKALEKDTTYYFAVYAQNAAGDGSEAYVSASTFTNPEAPTDLSAAVESSTQIKLTWTAPTENGGQEVSSYNVYYREKLTDKTETDENPENTADPDNSGNSDSSDERPWQVISVTEGTEYIVGNLTSGVKYEFKVTALNGTAQDDESPYSNTVEIIPAKEPSAPKIGALVSKNASAVVTSIEVSDNFGDAVNKYIIYVSADGGQTFTKHTEISTETDSSSDVLIEGLTNGTEYQIKVAAANNFGESEMSNAQTVTVGMPLAPNSIKAVPQPGQKIEVTFDAADAQGSNIVAYEVHFGGTKEGDEVDPNAQENIITTTSTTVEYDASDRINGDTVTAYVIAVSDVFTGARSEKSKTVTAALGSPSAPEITELTANEGGIELSWTAANQNGNARKYYTVTVVDENGTEKKFNTSNASTLSMSISKEDGGFEAAKTYGVYVTCTNSAGEGPESDTMYFTFGAPQAPIVDPPEMGDGELTVKWSRPESNGGEDIIGYKIYLNNESEPTMYVTWRETESGEPLYQLYVTDYRTDGTEYAYGEGQDNLDNFEVVIKNLANGYAYDVSVTAVNLNGEGPGKETDEPVTPATNASAPRDVTASAKSGTDVSIEWNKPYRDGGTPITGYTVAVYKTGEKNYDTGKYDDTEKTLAWENGNVNTGTSVEVGSLLPGGRYEVQVAAITAAGTGEFAVTTVCTHSKPSKPVITELISGVGETETLPLTVRWNAPEDDGDSNIIGYDVYAGTQSASLYKMNLEGIISPDATEYTINDIRLKNKQQYIVCVVVYNEVTGPLYKNGVSSDEEEIILGTIHAPKDVKVTGDTKGNMNIEWPLDQFTEEEKSYIDRYMIYVNDIAVTSTYTNEATLTLIPMGAQQKVQVSVISTFHLEGPKSEPVTITLGAPDAVEITKAEGTEGGAKVAWNAAAAVDSFDVTQYKVYVDGEAVQTIDASKVSVLEADITDLTPGQEYKINVTAVNDNGEGPMGEAVKVIPYAKPSTPIVKDIKAGIGEFSFTFDEPNSNGAEITGYEVYLDNALITANIDDNTNTVTVTDVSNGDTHEFYILAVNDKGLKSEEPTEPYEVTTGVPSPPEKITAAAGIGSAAITFSKSADISESYKTTGYEILQDGNVIEPQPQLTETADGNLTAQITGLTDGTEYSFSVRALNELGSGPASSAVTVKPGTPQAPVISKIVSGNGTLNVEWTEPEENAGRISKYTVYVNGILSVTTPDTKAELKDLTNGTTYMITVSATNYIGEGTASQPMSGTPGAVSGPVGKIAGEPGFADGSCNITLTWDEPSDTGGLPITSYIVEGDGNITVDSEKRTAIITGLEKGTEYTYTITPVNNAGNGEAKASEAITTLSEPDAPQLKSIAGTNRMITAAWIAPDTDVSEIKGYVIYAEPIDGGDIIRKEYTNPVADENGRYSFTLTDEDGVKVGDAYSVKVAAVNNVGEGAKSNDIEVTVTADIVQTVPGAPRDLTVTAGDSSAELTWKEPQYDGNSAIKQYVVWRGTSTDDMGYVQFLDSHTFSWTDTGLKNGTTYYYKVRAVNGVSTIGGDFSNIVDVTPTEITAPSKPIWVDFNNKDGVSAYEVNAQGNAMTLNWQASTGDEEFGAISYQVYVNGDLVTTTSETSYTYEGLTSNSQYNIQVKAVNERGAVSSSDFIHALRTLNIRKSDLEGFEYPTKYADDVFAYIDADYNGIEDDTAKVTNPSAPQNFNAVANENNTEVIITWSKPVDNGGAEITSYKVYIDGGLSIDPLTLSADDQSVLQQDGTYKYSYPLIGRAVTMHSFNMTAVNSEGLESTATSPKYAPISTSTSGVLDAPTGLTYEVTDKINIALTWAVVDGAESYVLYDSGSPKPIALDDENISISEDGTTVTYNYPSGKINTEYRFSVSAKSGTTESAVSELISFDTNETKAEAPQNVAVNCDDANNSVVISWEPPANADDADVLGYIVYVYGDPIEELTDETYGFTYTTTECEYIIGELKTVYAKVAAISRHGTIGELSATKGYDYNPNLNPNTPPMPNIDMVGYQLLYDENDGILLKENNLKFTWTAGNPVPDEHEEETAAYNIYVDGEKVAGPITELEYTCTVTAGKDCLIEVEPIDANGNTGPKAPFNLEVPKNEYTEPDKVDDLAAKLSEDNTKVTLTWTENSDLTYYLFVNGTKQPNAVSCGENGYEYTLDSSVKNYYFMVQSAKTYSDDTEVTADSNVVNVTVSSGSGSETADPNYASNKPIISQYISDKISKVRIFWKAPEEQLEGEVGTITEYSVVVDGTAVGTVEADQALTYEITGFSSVTDKKKVEIKAYKDISGTLVYAAASDPAIVSPNCNLVVNDSDYRADVTLPVSVTNPDTDFDGEPDTTVDTFTISGMTNTTGISIKLTDNFDNVLAAESVEYGETVDGKMKFTATFSNNLDATATMYSIKVTKDACTSYTVIDVSKADLPGVDIGNALIYYGDLDGDGNVTPSDVTIYNTNRGKDNASAFEGDLDGDGSVTPSDLTILLSNKGKGSDSISLSDV